MKSYLFAGAAFVATFAAAAFFLSGKNAESVAQAQREDTVPQDHPIPVVTPFKIIPPPSSLLPKSAQPSNASKKGEIGRLQVRLRHSDKQGTLVALKGVVMRAPRTGVQTVKIRALDNDDVELGTAELWCSTRVDQDTEFSISCRLTTPTYRLIKKWVGIIEGEVVEIPCSTLDLKVVRARTEEVEGDDKGKYVWMNFNLEMVIDNPTRYEYEASRNLTVQPLDSEGFSLGWFCLTRFTRPFGGPVVVDKSATIGLPPLTKKIMYFKDQDLGREDYGKIASWRVVPTQIGLPHYDLAE